MREDRDKYRPVDERIAEIFGRTTFRTGVEGGGTNASRVTTADVAQALGRVQSEFGTLVPFALETRYGMSLRHERELCTGWEAFGAKADPSMNRETKTFSRLACALAVRELAGAKHTAAAMAHYAWIACVRRQALEAAVWLIGSWLDELCQMGRAELIIMFQQRDAKKAA